MPLISFAKALRDSEHLTRRHLLLGNGFSIACRPNIFVYGKLFEQADFSKLSPSAKKVFKALDTQDFEKVIKALRDAKAVLSAYDGVSKKLLTTLQEDADGLRELLVQTIASSHPERPNEIAEHEYAACRDFLSNFNTIYTLNYDLLLYWTQMHNEDGVDPTSDDGFRKPEDDYDVNYVTWEPVNSHQQTTWFLHGALHLFDAGIEIQKYTWVNTGIRLIEQIRDALKLDYFPIFVAEGTSNEKLIRIRHNDYLAKAYRSFSEIGGGLFIYGHSLAKNDDHYLKCIEKGKITNLYIGIYGDPETPSNKAIIARANKMVSARASKISSSRRRRADLSVSFFDAGSAKVWEK
ncbi:DUF4917 family protein [Methylobacter sp. YRD-M1]|uniref:DUF4917 family protein n=1 Tax=Methylobacter sp. YRD-M1 TaxID=2911520 RepID=UPI00227CACF4|nr:DUF4917 family protein [Methylobacter sp. YRD-M1]WAK04576.1 DUF4917 family protein [Methylobacter sp. YRD-M1]